MSLLFLLKRIEVFYEAFSRFFNFVFRLYRLGFQAVGSGSVLPVE